MQHIDAVIKGMVRQGATPYEIFHAVYHDLQKFGDDKDINYIHNIISHFADQSSSK